MLNVKKKLMIILPLMDPHKKVIMKMKIDLIGIYMKHGKSILLEKDLEESIIAKKKKICHHHQIHGKESLKMT